MIIKLTKVLPPGDPTCLHQFNVLMRQCMNDLNMCEVQHSYYDMNAAIELLQHK